MPAAERLNRDGSGGPRHFIGIPDDLVLAILRGGQVGRVLLAIVYEQQRRHRAPGANSAVPISGTRFQELTGMSHATLYRALERARSQKQIVVVTGGGNATSTYAIADRPVSPAGQVRSPNAVSFLGQRLSHQRDTHKVVNEDSGVSTGPQPLSKDPSGEDTPLRLGLDMLATGIPVQIIKPESGAVIECLPEDHGPLLRLLGSNNPELAIAVLVADKPSPSVLSGEERFRVSARRHRVLATAEGSRQEEPLDKVLKHLEDSGYRPVRKGLRWESACPLCGRRAVLDVKERHSGKVNVKCHRGCSTEELLGAVGLTLADLYPRGLVA